MEFWVDGTCHYKCKSGSYNHSGVCVGSPLPSATPPEWATSSFQHARLKSRLHRFQDSWALETPWPLLSEISIQTDFGPWIAWSLRDWAPDSTDVDQSSGWLLLPHRVLHHVHVRAICGLALCSFRHTRWTSHGATFRKGMNMVWTWGMGGDSGLGDTSSVCSVRCVGGVLHSVHVANMPYSVFISNSTNGNVSDGLVWARGHTELLGVETVLTSYIEAQRFADAIVGVGGSRALRHVARVQAICTTDR
jgi:hypothetical protein